MKSNIPNILTCCNLLCGCIAVLFALGNSFGLALAFILFGAVFDFSDGLVARALGVSSPIGKELDSLADCITFGFAPSAILYSELCRSVSLYTPDGLFRVLPFAAFVLAAFSAVRLAKFNIDARQAVSFIGLPTPANALLWASLLTAYGWWFESCKIGWLLLIIMMLASCWLLVCGIPMFAMKFKHWGLKEKGNRVKYAFIAFSAAVIVVSAVCGKAVGSIAFIVLAYILLSVVMWIKQNKTPVLHA